MKQLLIIDGHPDNKSLCAALAESYYNGAKKAGHNVNLIKLRELSFNLNLQHGYRQRTTLEPDLLYTIELLKNTDHLVVVYPVWWGTFPALLKGFFDRTFLPGITYEPTDGVRWKKLLTGKTSRLIITMDAPKWYNWLVYGNASHKAIKHATLQYCGIQKVNTTTFAPIKTSTIHQRESWLKQVELLGSKGK